MSCDFKTTDIKLFQPHYDTCRQQNGYRCKLCKKLFSNVGALKAHNAEKHASEFTCNICNINYVNEATYKKHMETNHPSDIKAIDTSAPVAAGNLLKREILQRLLNEIYLLHLLFIFSEFFAYRSIVFMQHL